MIRCDWAQAGNQLMMDYHDHEWGFVTTNERETFELMVLEMMQAGLSWQTVLNKRAAFQTAFMNFDIDRVAAFDGEQVAVLMKNAAIIRNRRKIEAVIHNAQLLKKWHAEGRTMAAFLWQQVGNQQQVGYFKTMADVPATTPLAENTSKDLKKAGFKFVGPTIVYSWLQAMGILNDHVVACDYFEAARKSAVKNGRA